MSNIISITECEQAKDLGCFCMCDDLVDTKIVLPLVGTYVIEFNSLQNTLKKIDNTTTVIDTTLVLLGSLIPINFSIVFRIRNPDGTYFVDTETNTFFKMKVQYCEQDTNTGIVAEATGDNLDFCG